MNMKCEDDKVQMRKVKEDGATVKQRCRTEVKCQCKHERAALSHSH